MLPQEITPEKQNGINQLLQKGNVIGQQASEITKIPFTPNSPATSTITGQTIAPVTSLDYKTSAPTPVESVSDLSISAPAKIPLTPEETQADTLTQRVLDINNSLLGKTVFTQEKRTEFGVPEKEQAIADLTQQFNDLRKKEQAINVEFGGSLAKSKGVLEPFVTGERDARLRQNAIQALTISSTIDAANGLLASAQRKVNLAVEQKYGAIEEELKIKKENLDILSKSPGLSRAEKDRAAVQAINLKNQELLIAQKKEDQKDVWTLANTASQNIQSFHPTDQYQTSAVAIQAIQNAKTKEEALRIATDTGLTKLPSQPAGVGDITEFKQFFPNVNITTPEGRQQFLDWQIKQSEAKRAPVITPGVYVPGSNPTVDNWAKLIISGQAKITEVPNPKGSTLRSDVVNAINSSGQLLLSDKDREKLSTLDTAFNVYETIKGLSEKINTFGVGGRVAGYLGRYIGGITQYDTDIARYNAVRQGFVSNVARTLGEKGTLAEGDVQRAISNLPTANDTMAVAKGKLETLRKILQGAKESIIQKSTEPLIGATSGTLQLQTPEDLRNKYNY